MSRFRYEGLASMFSTRLLARGRLLGLAIVLAAFVVLVIAVRGDKPAAAKAHERNEAKAKPFRLDKRVPLTTSKVIGSPEAPPPYRVRRAYPELKPEFPIFVTQQPSSDRLLVITQERSY